MAKGYLLRLINHSLRRSGAVQLLGELMAEGSDRSLIVLTL